MLLQLALILCSVLASAKADYIIDDQDTSRVTYSSEGQSKWTPVNNLGGIAIGSSEAYNHTATYSVCSSNDDCRMTIYFQGSGITLYVINMESSINATIMVDGGFNMSTFTQVPMPIMYNVSAYSITDLDATSQHTVTASLNTYLPDGPLSSGFIFDFAIVTNGTSTIPSATEAMPTTTMSMSMGPSSTGSSTTSQSHSMIGAIVGGAVGGIVVVAALVAFLFYLHLRNRSRTPSFSDVDDEPKNGFSPEATTIDRYTLSPRSSQADVFDHIARRSAPAPFQFTPLTAETIARVRTPPSNYPSEKSQPRESTALSWAGSSAGAPDLPVSLTDEQIDFIRGLGSANVPPDDIARVIARMKADYGEGRVAASVPPGYES